MTPAGYAAGAMSVRRRQTLAVIGAVVVGILCCAAGPAIGATSSYAQRVHPVSPAKLLSAFVDFDTAANYNDKGWFGVIGGFALTANKLTAEDVATVRETKTPTATTTSSGSKPKLVKPGLLIENTINYDTGGIYYTGPGNDHESGEGDSGLFTSDSHFTELKLQDHYFQASAPCIPSQNGNNVDYERRNLKGEYLITCNIPGQRKRAPLFVPQSSIGSVTKAGQDVDFTSILSYNGDIAATGAGIQSDQYGTPADLEATAPSSKKQTAEIFYADNNNTPYGRQLRELVLTVKNGKETARAIWY